MAGDDAPEHKPPRTFGRRKGRPLRAGWQQLVDERLPALAVDLPATGHLDPRNLFDPPVKAVWLEIGFGAGEHLAWQAERHPNIGFLGAEVFINGVASLLRHLEERQLTNVRIFADDVRPLLERLAPSSLGRVFLLFPDPWPKARHYQRRFVQQETLSRLSEILEPGGELRIASDDMGYIAWSLAQIARHPDFEWLARRPEDWRGRPDDWPETIKKQDSTSAMLSNAASSSRTWMISTR